MADTGKVALITGAANGIGRAILQRFLEDGFRVVALDQDAPGLEAIPGDPDRLATIMGDVSRRSDVRDAVALAVSRFGRLDVFASNAGIADATPFLEIEDTSWHRILAVNLTGAFHCIQEAARAMTRTGGGAIVVTTSTNGFYVESNLGAYNASKGGVDALVRSAALDLAQFGIRVNSVAPSMVKTRAAFITQDAPGAVEYLQRVPMGRFAETAEIAAAVAFLASAQSSYVTGQSLILDGGLTLGIELPLPVVPLPD